MSLENGGVLGTTILSVEAGFGIWSALNPSYFTIAKFADTPQDITNIRTGMLEALGIMAAAAVGIRLAFGKKGTLPAIAHVSTGLGLVALYGFKIGWSNLINPQNVSYRVSRPGIIATKV